MPNVVFLLVATAGRPAPPALPQTIKLGVQYSLWGGEWAPGAWAWACLRGCHALLLLTRHWSQACSCMRAPVLLLAAPTKWLCVPTSTNTRPAGSVFNLGTEKHRRKYLEDIDRLRLPGGDSVRCV